MARMNATIEAGSTSVTFRISINGDAMTQTCLISQSAVFASQRDILATRSSKILPGAIHASEMILIDERPSERTARSGLLLGLSVASAL
jgi:hypothetical protein